MLQENDTEFRIKETARIIFQKNGFAGTKTRDIAEAAGINLALLNYYFRSKKKLYDLIMLETIHDFFGSIELVMNNESTTIYEKLVEFVNRYLDILSANKDMPMFIINEIKIDPHAFVSKIEVFKNVSDSVFVQQFKEEARIGNVPKINPIHLLMNLSSLVIFPFLASPLIEVVTHTSKSELEVIINERRRLIPLWIQSMLKVS